MGDGFSTNSSERKSDTQTCSENRLPLTRVRPSRKKATDRHRVTQHLVFFTYIIRVNHYVAKSITFKNKESQPERLMCKAVLESWFSGVKPMLNSLLFPINKVYLTVQCQVSSKQYLPSIVRNQIPLFSACDLSEFCLWAF